MISEKPAPHAYATCIGLKRTAIISNSPSDRREWELDLGSAAIGRPGNGVGLYPVGVEDMVSYPRLGPGARTVKVPL